MGRIAVDISSLHAKQEQLLSEEHTKEKEQLVEQQAERRVSLVEEQAEEKAYRKEREAREKERLAERQAEEKARLAEQQARAELAAQALCFGCKKAWIKVSLPPWEDAPRPEVHCIAVGQPVHVDTVFACNLFEPLEADKDDLPFSVKRAIEMVKDGQTYLSRSQQTEPPAPADSEEKDAVERSEETGDKEPPKDDEAPDKKPDKDDEAGDDKAPKTDDKEPPKDDAKK